MKLCARCWDEPVMPPPAGAAEASGPVTLESLNITTIVVGFDFCFSATTVAIASMLLQRDAVIPGASRVRYVTPNVDPQVNVGERNWRMPGTGSLQAAIQRASGRQPDIICGKPNPELLRLLLSTENEKLREAGEPPLRADQCLMVGDRMSTDIAFGRSAGARTLLVETGCETVADIPSEEEAINDPAGKGLLVPHFTAPGIVEAVRLLADAQS
jgi:4-nitrophenyl phosphatase